MYELVGIVVLSWMTKNSKNRLPYKGGVEFASIHSVWIPAVHAGMTG
jgi:hypothetical protein